MTRLSVVIKNEIHWLVGVSLCLLIFDGCCIYAADAPNIIFIVADDLGWNDVSFHGSNQIPTPNIDALAYNGVIFNSHYVQASSSSSRTALLTAKYPMKLGMQGSSIKPAEPRSLPEGKLMPEYLKEIGYTTYLVGKWNLGYVRWNDTPTFRGFDHHLGYFNGWTSYYDYLTTVTVNGKTYSGFDLRRDTEPAWDLSGQYATDIFTNYAVETIENHDVNKPLFMMVSHLAPHSANPGKLLEAPQETINKFKYVIDSSRRTYAAMVTKIDESVGAMVAALEQKGMLQNSIVVFISDNGAPTVGEAINWGSNFPLRGIKGTLWEGGVRGVACIWSPRLPSGMVTNNLIHITDWLPTLFSAAGGDISLLDPDIDGLDQWSSLEYYFPSPRNDILINIDERSKNAALRFSNWKLIVGTVNNGSYDTYFGESGNENIQPVFYNTSAVFQSPVGQAILKTIYTSTPENNFENIREQATIHCLEASSKKNACNPADGEICLYDIPNDPCEENNIANFFPSVVRKLKRDVVDYKAGLVKQINQDVDIDNSDPKLYQFTWNPWHDCQDVSYEKLCLYDIIRDPCEENNIAKYFPTVVKQMKRTIIFYKRGLAAQVNQILDIDLADPKYYMYTWQPWK